MSVEYLPQEVFEASAPSCPTICSDCSEDERQLDRIEKAQFINVRKRGTRKRCSRSQEIGNLFSKLAESYCIEMPRIQYLIGEILPVHDHSTNPGESADILEL